MATKKVYDLAVKTGSYTDSNGKEKGRYQNVGSVLEKDDGGKFIILERWFNPAGVVNPENKGSVILSMFEPKDFNAAPEKSTPAERKTFTPNAALDDDIPF